MEINFCRRCGTRLQAKGAGAYLCEKGHHVYYKTYPAAGILLVNSKEEVLMTVRAIEPNKGTLDNPGGFCDPGETFEETLRRELHEELGLAPTDYDKPQFLIDAVDEYPYEGEITPGLNVIFWAHIRSDEQRFIVADDVASCEWLPLAGFDSGRLAKHAHSARVAIVALQKLLNA
jgi:NAD+ diphosphatase